jgi:hypothetical protein
VDWLQFQVRAIEILSLYWHSLAWGVPFITALAGHAWKSPSGNISTALRFCISIYVGTYMLDYLFANGLMPTEMHSLPENLRTTTEAAFFMQWNATFMHRLSIHSMILGTIYLVIALFVDKLLPEHPLYTICVAWLIATLAVLQLWSLASEGGIHDSQREPISCELRRYGNNSNIYYVFSASIFSPTGTK